MQTCKPFNFVKWLGDLSRLLIFLAGLVALPMPTIASDTSGFRMIILENGMEDEKKEDTVMLVIGMEDLQYADALGQQMVLTAETSLRLAQAAGQAADKRSDIIKLNRLKEQTGLTNSLELDLYLKKFRVEINGRLVYEGIFLDSPSSRRLDIPVARVLTVNNQAQINVLPIHIPFAQQDPTISRGAGMGGFDYLVNSPSYLRNRTRMHSPILVQEFAKAGKPLPASGPDNGNRRSRSGLAGLIQKLFSI